MKYGYSRKVDADYAAAVSRIKEELAKEGFGILTEADVKAVLKKKLDKDIDNYVILGACNPPNAYKSLQAETEIGLMLPCNVIVYSKDGGTYVSAILPTVAMGMIDNPKLLEVAENIEEKLKRAVDAV